MPGRNTNWLQGQDSNLRYRDYEPRGSNRACPPCLKSCPYRPGLTGLSAACCGARTGDPAIVTSLPDLSRPGGEKPDACMASVRHTSKKKARRTVKVRQPGASWRGETQSARAGTSSCGGLHRSRRPRNIDRPFNFSGPVYRKPSNDLVVLLCRERFAVTNTREEPSVGRAMAPNSCLSKVFRRSESLRKREKMASELSFHAPVIVGCIPLFNRKHPSRQVMWKFPMVSA